MAAGGGAPVRVTQVRTARRGLPIALIFGVILTVLILTELVLFYLMAQLVGWLATILIALLTGIVGLLVIRSAGLSVMRRFQAELLTGRFPQEAIAEGVVILLGGVFLISPGQLSDLIGLSTLIPPVRRVYARVLARLASRAFVFAPLAAAPGAGFMGVPPAGKPSDAEKTGPTVFDVPPDVEDVDPKGRDSEPIDVEFRRTE
jgi:UPF0716 protein FxsA